MGSESQKIASGGWCRKILANAFAAAAVLLVARFTLVGLPWAWRSLPTLAMVGYCDLVFIMCGTAVFAVLLWRLPQKSAAWLARLHYALAVVTVLLGLANIKTVWILGQPATWSWLAYSDFLTSRDSQTAISGELDFQTVFFGAATLALFVLGRQAVLRLLVRAVPAGKGRPAGLVLAVLCAAYTVVGALHSRQIEWDSSKVQNAMWIFLRSCAVRDEFFPVQTIHPVPAAKPLPAVPPTFAALHQSEKRPHNVVFFVMESVGAKFPDICGGSFDVTPNLKKKLPAAARFEHFFAAVPQTDKTTVSLVCGIYPLPSRLSITKDLPGLDVESLGGILQKQGYRTAWFNGCDLRFAGQRNFLGAHGFDFLEDCRDRRNRCPVISNGGVDADGSPDACTVDSMLDWVGGDTNRPFYAVIWTSQTHVPYSVCQGGETDFGVKNPCFNRYLNAIRESDQAFGNLMQALQLRGLADDTLVVVVGDHGEVLDENRDQVGLHANHIYDANIHVPCLLICPGLFHGETRAEIGSMKDLPATVLDILGLDVPGDWQGVSLFAPQRPGGIFLHTAIGRSLYGYRDEKMKWIYDGENRAWQVFDVVHDPEEQTNLAGRFPQECETLKQRLLVWVRAEHGFVSQHLPPRETR